MNKEFIPYEQALELKKLGFNEPCFGYWNIDPYLPKPTFNLVKPFDHEWCIPAPLYQQAFRWFRENYPDLDFAVGKIHNGTNKYHYHINLQWEFFECTYEEAELACLKKLIEIVKNK